jgi:muramoyltetrapeptide carboxypeptidase LdcA involved in peptidoglycan recycling
MLDLARPPKLSPGDKVAAVTLSWGGPGAFPARYDIGKRQLQAELGVEVVEMRHALRDPAWLAAHPEARAADLMEAFSDTSIRAVFSTIGGDDSIRLIRHLDLDVIRRNPKIFMGYSDTTVAHFACLRAGLGSFYGPSFMAGFAENTGMFPYTVRSLKKSLFSAAHLGEIEPNLNGWTVEHLDWGVAEHQSRRRKLTPATGWRFLQGRGVRSGPLLGGCADVLEFLKATALWPAPEVWDGAVLFLETSEEAPTPTHLKYWLRNYAAQGILERVNGILFGRPGGAIPDRDFDRYDEALLQVVRNELGLTELPIVTRMDFGHTDPTFIVPIGRIAVVDCEQRTLSIPEPAVADRH